MAAKNWINEDMSHSRQDDIVGFARGFVSYKVGNKGYSADIVVAIKDDNTTLLYDMVGIKDKKIIPNSVGRRSPLASGLSGISDNTLPHPGEDVKGRSSRIAADSAFAYTATAKENEGLRKTVASLSRALEKTLYFGILDPTVLDAIQSKVPNMPKALNGRLFKPETTYSIAATLDSIRHIVDEKPGLSRGNVIDFLDRFADTIIDNDRADFHYAKDGRSKGILCKKSFDDGVTESFSIVSKGTRSIGLKTIYIEEGDYKKRSLPRPC